MTPLWWSVLLAIVGINGIYLAGRARPAIGQYGFILTALAYGSIYALNLRRALRRVEAS